MRILFCTHCPANERTAVYQSISTHADYLRRCGHSVDILTPEDLVHSRVARLDPIVLPPLVARYVSAYDVVVFHSYMGWTFHAFRRWFDPHKRVATMTSFHGLEPLYQHALSQECARHGDRLSMRFRLLHQVILPRLIKASCRRSDAVLCLNSTEVDYLAREGWADRERVFLVANGAAPADFIDRPHRTAARRLLFVGQWLPAKGIRYLVQAFASIASQADDVELACVGTGAPGPVVLGAFPAAVRGRVTVLPSVDRAELRAEFTRADVFVFPSLSEGFSCALIEALAAGLPIVATPAGAAVDLLTHEMNALVVPCADAAALSVAARRLLADGGLRERLGVRARQTAMQYTTEQVCRSFARYVTAVATRHLTPAVVPDAVRNDAVS